MKDQSARILGALLHGAMTTGEIMDQLGIGRPGARISELRSLGVGITTEWVAVPTRWAQQARVARYSLTNPTHARQFLPEAAEGRGRVAA